MKKVISLCLVMAILATMFAVSFTALSVSDEGSVSAKDAIAATGGNYDDFVGSSTKLYFDAKSTGWDMSGTNKIGFFAFPLSAAVADNYKSWGGKRLQGSDKDGDGIWEFDATPFKLEEGVQYKIIFAHVINNAFASQTYDLFFDTTCLGHVAYCTGKMYENPVDSSKKTLAAFWDGKDDSEYGPVLQLSSIGNVLGTCPEQGRTPYDIFVDYISVVSSDSGKTGLDNSRAYVVDVGTKTEQKLIDDIGAGLSLTKEDVEKAFTDNAVETVWTAADSTLPGGSVHEHTPAEPVVENEVVATCTAEGSYDEVVYCTECGEEISRVKKTIAKLVHTPGNAKQENVVAATCTKEGSYDEVVKCTECGEEISRVKKTIAKLSHTPGNAKQENVVAATCTKEGSYDEVVKCIKCGEEISRVKKTIAKLAHTPGEAKQENVVAATCTKEGSYNEVVRCKVCNVVISTTPKTTAKIAHTPGEAKQENVVPATCTKEGSYNEVVRCKVCNEVISSTPKTTAKIAHTPGEAKQENVVPASCTKEGSYNEVVRCKVCNVVISSTPKTIAKTAHATVFVAEVSATYEKDGCKAHYKCTSCGKLFTDATGNVETTEAALRIPKLTPTEPKPTEPPVGKVVRGDIDGDGDVTIVDVVVIQRIDIGIITADTAMKAAGDVNCDGAVDIIDATLVQRYLVGLNSNDIGKAI